MIIRTEYNNTYFLLLEHMYTEDQWLAAAGVRPNSPAASIAARVFSCFFRGIKDVGDEYRKYYEREYCDLRSFLYWHYMVDEDAIDQICQTYNPQQLLLYGNVHSGGDYCVGDYAMDKDEGFLVVQRILATLSKKNKK